MMPKYIKILDTSGEKLVDTSILIPHLECYLIKDNQLYFESTDGIEYFLGNVLDTYDTLEQI